MYMIDKEMLKGIMKILVLKVISLEDTYGYDLIKTLKMLSHDLIDIKEGTLYPILHNFEAQKDIRSYWIESDKGRKRKYYSITDKGLKTLAELTSQWQLLEDATHLILEENHGTVKKNS